MRLAILAAVVLLIPACGAGARQTFDKGGKSEDLFYRENAACELEGEKGRRLIPGGGLEAIATYYESYNMVYNACMKSMGYRLAKEPTAKAQNQAPAYPGRRRN